MTPTSLFAGQHGLASDRQLTAAGVAPAARRNHLELGEWERFSPGVIRLSGTPDDWRQPAMAVTVGTSRAAVTGPTCLRLRGLDGFAHEEGLFVATYQGDEPSSRQGPRCGEAGG